MNSASLNPCASWHYDFNIFSHVHLQAGCEEMLINVLLSADVDLLRSMFMKKKSCLLENKLV